MKTGKVANRRIPVSLAFAVFAACCAPADEEATPAGMRDEVYVQVMAELMILDANLPAGETVEEQEARADSMRAEILAAQGVTARELLNFVEVVGSEASRMESLWALITQKYDSARIADLRRETEAQSETEGKLGAEARAGASGSATVAPGGADSSGTAGGPEGDAGARTRGRALRRPVKSSPEARDTTVQQG
ncbi:MAG: hypothetical protein WBO43_13435 [Gemmatimonadota bacterium]